MLGEKKNCGRVGGRSLAGGGERCLEWHRGRGQDVWGKGVCKVVLVAPTLGGDID